MTASSHSSSAARAYAFGVLAVAMWGASFIATKIAVRETNPSTVICLRFGIGAASLAVIAALRGELAWPERRSLGLFAGLGAIGITIHQWLQTTGLVTAQATTTSWIITASPLAIAVVGRIVLHEHLRWRQIAGIVLGSTGVLLVVSHGDWRAMASGTFGSVGDALVTASTVTWAFFSVYSRRGLQQYKAAPMMTWVMVAGWLFAAIPWVVTGDVSAVARLDVAGWGSLVFLGVFCGGFSYIYWYEALAVLPAAKVGSLLYLEPLVTMAVASLVLGEAMTVGDYIGAAVILAGVRIATLK